MRGVELVMLKVLFLFRRVSHRLPSAAHTYVAKRIARERGVAVAILYASSSSLLIAAVSISTEFVNKAVYHAKAF